MSSHDYSKRVRKPSRCKAKHWQVYSCFCFNNLIILYQNWNKLSHALLKQHVYEWCYRWHQDIFAEFNYSSGNLIISCRLVLFYRGEFFKHVIARRRWKAEKILVYSITIDLYVWYTLVRFIRVNYFLRGLPSAGYDRGDVRGRNRKNVILELLYCLFNLWPSSINIYIVGAFMYLIYTYRDPFQIKISSYQHRIS